MCVWGGGICYRTMVKIEEEGEGAFFSPRSFFEGFFYVGVFPARQKWF